MCDALSKLKPENLGQHRIIPGTYPTCRIFRHIVQKYSAIHKVLPAFFEQSDENPDGALYAPELCGVALGDITLETSIYYAEAITQKVEPPKVCTFDNVHFMFIDEISKRYKDCTLVEDVTFEGTIKMLYKSTTNDKDEVENTVRLLTKVDGQMRSITLHLSPENHTKACNAYRDDNEVRVSGTIDKSGKNWFFTEVSEFDVI